MDRPKSRPISSNRPAPPLPSATIIPTAARRIELAEPFVALGKLDPPLEDGVREDVGVHVYEHAAIVEARPTLFL